MSRPPDYYFLLNIVNQKFMIEFSVDLRVNFKSTDLLYPAADGGQDLMVESACITGMCTSCNSWCLMYMYLVYGRLQW